MGVWVLPNYQLQGVAAQRDAQHKGCYEMTPVVAVTWQLFVVVNVVAIAHRCRKQITKRSLLKYSFGIV